MSFKFLDDPAAPSSGGFVWLDSPDVRPRGVSFVEGGPEEKPSLDELEKRFSDIEYSPTLEEFRVYGEQKKEEPFFQPGKWAGLALGAAGEVLTDLYKGAKGAVQTLPDVPKLGRSLAEGATRGTFDLGMLGRGIMERVGLLADDLNEDQFLASKVSKVNAEAFPNGITPGTTLLTPADVPKGTLKDWKKEFSDYKLNRDYDRFLTTRALTATREEARRGTENLLPIAPERVNTDVAEAASRIADLTLLVPGATEGRMLSTLASRGARVAGGATEALGRGVRQIAEIPGNYLERGVTAAKGTPFESFTKAKAATLQAAPALVAGIAGGVEASGQALAVLGEKMATGATRLKLLEQIAKDTTKPAWMRKSSSLLHRAGMDQVLALAGTAAGGALEGAGVGAILGGAAGGMEGAASGFGAGGVLGAGGALAGRVLGARTRTDEARLADRARYLASQLDRGTSPETLAKLNGGVVDAATYAEQIFGGDLSIRLVEGTEFGQLSKDNVGRAYYLEQPGKTPQIVVNVESMAGQTGNDLLHEIGHALFKSPVVNRAQVASAFFATYGETGLAAASTEYARKLTLNRKMRFALDATRGNLSEHQRAKIKEGITEDQVNATKQELAAADPEWLIGEVFAEQFLDAAISGRLGPTFKGGSTDALLGATLRAKSQMLGAMGVPLDSAGAIPKPERLFNDFQVRGDPKLQKMIRGYLQDRDRFLSGLDVAREGEGGARVTLKDLAQHPAAGWQWNAKQGFYETDYAVKLANGEIILKAPKAIAALEQKRVEDLAGLFPKQTLDASDRRVGPRIDAAGRTAIRGEILPEAFYQLGSFSEETKRVARQLQDAIPGGDVFNVWLQKIGTGSGKDSWAQSVRKNLGNLRVDQRDFKPLGFHISGPGNLLVTVLDVSAALKRAMRWHAEKKLDALWAGDLNRFRTDMERYLKNHSEGLPGESNGLGLERKNALNAFFGVTDKDSGGFNPLRAEMRGDDKKSLVKSFRIDRMQSVKPTGQLNWWFDYGKQKKNLLPEYGRRRLTGNALPHLNAITEARRIVSDAEFDQAYKAANSSGTPKGLKLEARDKSEKSYSAIVTRSVKSESLPWQVTYWFDDFPISDIQTETQESALRTALESNFQMPNKLVNGTEKR